MKSRIGVMNRLGSSRSRMSIEKSGFLSASESREGGRSSAARTRSTETPPAAAGPSDDVVVVWLGKAAIADATRNAVKHVMARSYRIAVSQI